MNDLFRQVMLFDFYSPMLTPKQQDLCRMHLLEDWSLAEIAEEREISRQAVSDAIKHGIQTMEKTEEQLHMVERFLTIKREIDTLDQLIEADSEKEELRKQIRVLREAISLEETSLE